MQQLVREILFFILVFSIFFLGIKLGQVWIQKSGKTGMHSDLIFLTIGVIYTLLIALLYSLVRVDTKEKFWDVSDFAKCKGGPYFWQGDSPTANMCRQLASTPEGRIGISSYNCPTGYVGQPGLPFYYTPLSDDKWQNERCEDLPECPTRDVGLCSLEKQVP